MYSAKDVRSLGGDQVNPLLFTKELYKKNAELLEQRRRIEQLLYSVSEAIFAVDRDHKITLFNRAAERLVGKRSVEVLGKTADEVISINYEKGLPIKSSDYAFQTTSDKSEHNAVILTAGIKQYYVNLKAALSEEGLDARECIVILTDITREKELEKTKDDFISVTSHELRTPMTIIKSYLWMLGNEKKGTLNDKQKEYLEKAIKGAERMLNLINDTLNISRIEQGRIEFKMEMANFKEILDEICTDFKIKTDEKNIYLKETLMIENEIKVFVDRNKLREIITNFLGNSYKFTKEGGIEIKVEPTEDNKIKVSIIDTGRGIDPEDLPKLFHKFGRLDNSYTTVAESGGTGLGLYIVKSLVEKMGGEVGCASDGLNKGSTFWFTLSTAPLDLK